VRGLKWIAARSADEIAGVMPPGSSLVIPQLRVFPVKSLVQDFSGSWVERFCTASFAGADQDRDLATDVSFIARLSKGHRFHALDDAALSADVASHRLLFGGHRLSPLPSPCPLSVRDVF
jgi:hypothetical protein